MGMEELILSAGRRILPAGRKLRRKTLICFLGFVFLGVGGRCFLFVFVFVFVFQRKLRFLKAKCGRTLKSKEFETHT